MAPERKIHLVGQVLLIDSSGEPPALSTLAITQSPTFTAETTLFETCSAILESQACPLIVDVTGTFDSLAPLGGEEGIEVVARDALWKALASRKLAYRLKFVSLISCCKGIDLANDLQISGNYPEFAPVRTAAVSVAAVDQNIRPSAP